LSKNGFTLVELIVVIAVLGILAAVVAPNAFKAIEKAKIARAVSDFRTIKQAGLTIYIDVGLFPTEGAWCAGPGFMNISDVPATYQSLWKGPYLEKWSTNFPWGTCVSYLRGEWGTCFDFDGSANNDSYVHYYNTSSFTSTIKQKIDTILDDGNLTTGVVRDCRGGLVYLIGEGPRW
jgi:general secretion pathway protein G